MLKNKLFLCGCALVVSGISIYLLNDYQNKLKTLKKEETIVEIKSHFHSVVKVINETPFYTKENEFYKQEGIFEEGTILSLKEEEIFEDTNYFLVTNFDKEYYISYKDVVPSEEKTKDTRYQKYIPFNMNIITNDVTRFYQNEKLMFTFYNSFEFPVIKKEENKYYIEFQDELYYVVNEDVKEILEKENSKEVVASKIPTIAYHFIYNPEKGQKCDQVICHTFSQVQSHIDFLKENNYVTLTMEDFELWIDGKINLPKNSILITVDDGWYGDEASQIFTQNEVNATIFVVSSWYDPKPFETKYVEVHSHGDNIHNANACKGQGKQGGGILCLPKEILLNDLKLSREKTNMTTSFAYPFYDVNDYAISVLKEAGFTMAFIGLDENNMYYMTRNTNKYKIPRMTILNNTTASQLQTLLNY